MRRIYRNIASYLFVIFSALSLITAIIRIKTESSDIKDCYDDLECIEEAKRTILISSILLIISVTMSFICAGILSIRSQAAVVPLLG